MPVQAWPQQVWMSVVKTKLCIYEYVTGKYICMEPKAKTGYK